MYEETTDESGAMVRKLLMTKRDIIKHLLANSMTHRLPATQFCDRVLDMPFEIHMILCTMTCFVSTLAIHSSYYYDEEGGYTSMYVAVGSVFVTGAFAMGLACSSIYWRRVIDVLMEYAAAEPADEKSIIRHLRTCPATLKADLSAATSGAKSADFTYKEYLSTCVPILCIVSTKIFWATLNEDGYWPVVSVFYMAIYFCGMAVYPYLENMMKKRRLWRERIEDAISDVEKAERGAAAAKRVAATQEK